MIRGLKKNLLPSKKLFESCYKRNFSSKGLSTLQNISSQASTNPNMNISKRGEERNKKSLEDLSINGSYGTFTLISKDYFSDYDFTLYKFKHSELGTTHYHIDTSDTNNCFAFNFTTLPEDSTGKMHILEHLALCGSDKYPVRDPFMNMIRRSLNTYMNAWTGPDFTCYPFSTVNVADFYNLMSVYGEAVFKPLLRKTDFMQEGWRLEFEETENDKSPLHIKGVVYNEMKGVYENPDNLYMESLQSFLMEGTPYRHDSGGTPSVIPELSHEDLKKYHKKNYHPSNATLFSYGDLNPLEHQKFLEETFLKEFSNQTYPKPSLTPEITEPLRKTVKMPPSAVEIKPGHDTWFSVGFVCNEIDKDHNDMVGLSLLSSLLFDNPKSPFYIDFLEEGLADGYVPGNGYEQNIFPSFFSIGFKNIKKGTEKEIESKIFETLEKVAKEGLDKAMIESTIHQIELNTKIAKPNFGIQLLMSHFGALNHKIDSLLKGSLDIKTVLAEIRKNVEADNGYFENLIKKYFLNNQKRLYLTMETDKNYLDGISEAEAKLIKSFEKDLNEAKKKQIVEETMKLKKEQEQPQETECLPTLTVKDIPLQGESTLGHKEQIDGIDTFFFHKPTNGVTHLRLKIDLSSLDSSNIHQLYIFSLMLNKVGTKKHGYQEFNDLMQLYTTGFDMRIYYDGLLTDKTKTNGFAVISLSCLDRNIEKMMELLGEVLTTPDFKDSDHILNLIRLDSSAAANSIVERPLEFAIDYGVSSQSPAHQLFNKVSNVIFDFTVEPIPLQFWFLYPERRNDHQNSS